MIISFCGAPGSGKSTIAKMLAEKLGWNRYYIGGLRRQKAKERGMAIAEYNKLGETDPSTDFEVDEYQKKLGETEDNFVIEGRTSWHFIPHSLKIYLDVEEDESARRIFEEMQNNNNRNEGERPQTIGEVKAAVKARMQSDRKRYKKYFNIDVFDKNHYDYVLDTTNLNIDQVFEKIYDFVRKNKER